MPPNALLRQLIIFLLALIAFSLPWSSAGVGGALSFNALDLAEWASLHPASQAQIPVLLSTALIRIALAFMGITICFSVSGRAARIAAAAALIIITAWLLPPPEFLRDTGNANYAQMAFIAVFTAGAGLAGLLTNPPLRRTIATAAVVLGSISAVTGALSANAMLATLDIPFVPGMGMPLTIIAFGLAAFFLWREKKDRTA